jgi:EAL domain-containing protein (putative c-di-GMP-specific phosphodiesterase class I)
MLFISLSGQSLGDASFLDFVVDSLDRTGVAPERVCFEVAEGSTTSNVENARRFMGVLHGMGSRFGIAEFGRGMG